MGSRTAGGRSRRTGNSTPFHIEVVTGPATIDFNIQDGGNPMTIKSLLSSVSLALLLSGAAVAAQAQIAIGQLADYSGGTSDVGTPYGQGVADAFAWANKNGGIGGKPVSVDTVDYGYQVPKAVALYKKWSSPDSKVAAIMGWGTADTEALTGFVTQDKIPDISGSYAAALSDPTGASGKPRPRPITSSMGRPIRMRCAPN